MLAHIRTATEPGKEGGLEDAEADANRGAELLPQVTGFVSRIGDGDLRATDAEEKVRLAIAATELNMISEILKLRILPLFSSATLTGNHARLADMYELMEASVRDAVVAIRDRDTTAAERVLSYKDDGETAFADLAMEQVSTPESDDSADDLRSRIEIAQTLRVLMMITRRAARTVLNEA